MGNLLLEVKMSHTVALIFVTITIAILGLMVINLLWISGRYIDTFGMAYPAKLDIYRKFKKLIAERTPEKVKEMLFLYGLSEFEYPSGTAFSISMPNKIDLKPMKGILIKIGGVVDLITHKPMFVRLLGKKKANTFIEIYNGAAEGKAIIAYTRINADDGTPFSTFSVFLYSNSDFETLKIDMHNPNSLFACAYIADFSIVHKRYLTLGESKFMHDYMMEKENKEA